MAECKNKVIAVVGPTASGKTSLGVQLCRAFNGEVISCDSMQIYRDMAVATAVPTLEERQGVPHHMMEFLSLDEEFSVARYCDLASRCMDEVIARGHMPVIVGGTGLYFNALVDNTEFFEEDNDYSYRAVLKEEAERDGAQVLLERLRGVDPETAEKLHVNNLGRIIRALEVYHLTGRTMSETQRLSRLRGSRWEPIIIGLDAENRDFLYDRINRRVDEMVKNGLVEEAKSFYAAYDGRTSTQAIGYKELKPYLDGEASLEECIEHLKLATRHYAKRQLTWFRRDERIHFLNIDRYESAESLARAAKEIIEKELAVKKEGRTE